MSSINTASENRKRVTSLGLVVAIAAGVLFAYFVKRAGVGQITAGIRNLGIGFVLILAISSVRQLARSIAWVFCAEGNRLRFPDALRARLMGDAIGNILPFASFIVSEPAKPALIRDRVPLTTGLSSIVIENIFYSISVIIFITTGMVTALLTFNSNVFRIASLVTFAAIFIIVILGGLCLRREIRVLSGVVGLFQRWFPKGIDRARAIEEQVYGFHRRHRSRFLPILFFEGCFHCAGVLEIYTTLWFISPAQPPTLFKAFILESVNRLISMIFKFIPLRLGVDEAGTAKVSALLQFSEPAGVTLAIIRKARDLFWSLIGVGLLFHRQITLRRQPLKAGENFIQEREPDLMMLGGN
ncbi:MAG TPA: lysylphosphatidylglycerol synthase transmembrane domain-containing protein [Pyrinomonadaceae bacterium]|nr:lysylphosphatidylglycerol synthase transmembrane domain-containing protein [Pyrinomonadaceae bacterium]